MSWKEYLLGDLITVKHGHAFKSQFFTASGDQIVLTPGNFYEEGGFKLRGDRDRYYSGEYPSEYLLKKDDIIIAMTEQGEGLLGSSALIPEDNKYLHNQRLGLVRIKNEALIDEYYLYKLFNTKDIRHQISASASGVKVRHTSPDRIYKCKADIPPFPIQKKIAAILSAYDDLIENNLKRIKLLEEMAQITYEEWFVRLRFPGHESTPIDSTTGLPEGWQRKENGECCEVSGGGTPSREIPEYWENGTVKWFSPTDLSKANSLCLLDSSDKITELGLKTSSAKLMGHHTFMMTSRATIGLFGLIDAEYSTNQGFINVSPLKPDHKYYLLFNFKYRVDEFIGHASGATFLEISKSKFKKLKIIWPSENTISEFHKYCFPIIAEMMNLTKQNQRLREARDILLPRLMTGMIDAETYNPANLLKDAS